jgi:hypothetical protein
MKNSLTNSDDSLNRKMPRIAVPNAPMPVHIAYAVPNGISLIEKERSTILKIMLATVKTLGQNFVKPFEYFKPTAQQISNRPATIKMNQDIIF